MLEADQHIKMNPVLGQKLYGPQGWNQKLRLSLNVNFFSILALLTVGRAISAQVGSEPQAALVEGDPLVNSEHVLAALDCLK